MIFRPLRADEVELRVSTCNANGFSLLLYKDARCDMNILDETVGPMNWTRQHCRDNANCIVSIWDEEKKQWISKEDTGTESFSEKEKGLASDSFKRACFNWGIGRELYTAPFIWIAGNTKKNDKGKYIPADNYDRNLRITELESENGVISKLVIKDKNSRTVFNYSKGITLSLHPEKSQEWKDARDELIELAEVKGVTIDEVVKMAKVSSLDELSIERLKGAHAWLANK